MPAEGLLKTDKNKDENVLVCTCTYKSSTMAKYLAINNWGEPERAPY